MADYAKSIDEKSAELLQAYNDAETEDEKRKAKKTYPFLSILQNKLPLSIIVVMENTTYGGKITNVLYK